MVIWLSEADIRASLTISDLIPAMETALVAFSAGQVNQPVRNVLVVDPDRSFFATMPAYVPGIPALGLKLVTIFAANHARGLPGHLATILLNDPETGALQAVLDGRYITEARTAAVSAVAVHRLVPPGVQTLAIVGSGVQARSHLAALALIRDFKEVRCWSPNADHLHAFTKENSQQAVIPAASAESAVRGADVVVLATSSLHPVVERAWVKDGACVVSVGACRPNHREMDPELVACAKVFVDSRASALQESGDIVLGIREGRFQESHILGELGELILNPGLGRAEARAITVFKSLGLAVEDIAAAHLAYNRAIAMGKGLALA